jgi:hypothetical protein
MPGEPKKETLSVTGAEFLITEKKDKTLKQVFGTEVHGKPTSVVFAFPTTEQLDADISAGAAPTATAADKDKAKKAGWLKRLEKRIDEALKHREKLSVSYEGVPNASGEVPAEDINSISVHV